MIRTPLCDILDIKHPIILGGMAWVGTAEYAATVSNAGGLGLLGSATMPKKDLIVEINKLKSLTDKSFGVNLVPLDHSQSGLFERAEACVETGIKIVSTAFSDPKKPLVRFLKDHGVMVMGVVPSVRLGKRMVDEGASVIIASGCEAGGHVGKISSLPLIPQMVDAVGVPVVAAGGIADARGFAAALSLGAVGIQMGTRFIATQECPVPLKVKEFILRCNDESTIVTGKVSGTTMRVLKNRLTDIWTKMEEDGEPPEAFGKFGLGKYGEGVLQGDIDMGSVPASQACGLIGEIPPVADLLETMVKEASDICRNMMRFAY